MKIAIIGRTQWLYNTVLRLKDGGHKIKSIITAKASPEYARKEDDFKKLASKIKANFFLSKNLNDPEIASVINGLDAGISVNWPHIVTQEQIARFRLGILNAHMGDLPKYRGNACPNWAIINGEDSVTVSIHLMEGGKLDCGRVIAQDDYPLTEDTYIGQVYKWAEDSIPELFGKALSVLQKDHEYTFKYADPHSPDSLRCYPRRLEDGRINWKVSASEIHRLIRASSRPFSGAYAFIDGNEKITIWKAEMAKDLSEKYCAVQGQIASISADSFTVITGKGKLKITEWDTEGKICSIRQRMT